VILSAQIQQVDEVPEWFLHPPAGEYVGVSLPLKNRDLAEKQAVYTALLSYMAQHDVEGKLQTTEYAYGKTNEKTHSRQDHELLLPLPINYKIIKASKNKYGEVFVAVNILPSNKVIKVAFEKEYKYKSDFTHSSQFVLDDSANFNIMANIFKKSGSNSSNEEVEITMRVLDKTSGSNEQCVIDEASRYRYNATVKLTSEYRALSAHTVRQSLGVGYLMALLQLLSAKEYWCCIVENGTLTENETDGTKNEMDDVLISIYQRNVTRRNATPIESANISGDELFLEAGKKAATTIAPNTKKSDVDIDKILALFAADTKKSDIDTDIPMSNTSNDKTFAVIIANEAYQEKEVSNVEFAVHDGEIFKEYCIKTLGLPEVNVHYRANATLNNIRSEISWLAQVAKSYIGEASVIFYYAGHGVSDEASKSAYLLPVDGYGSDVKSGYSLDDLYAKFGAMPSRSVTVFLDACFSGANRDGSMLVAARSIATKAKTSAPVGNMVVFSASQGDETAYPYKEKGHGLFTYFLLKKLQESKGNVTLGELGSYISTNVAQRSIVVNRKSQTPTVIPSASMVNWQEMRLK
jgi:hypothetical protein